VQKPVDQTLQATENCLFHGLFLLLLLLEREELSQ
jgi:hypothetical protein